MSVHNRVLDLAPHLARTLASRGAWYFDRKVRVQRGLTLHTASTLFVQGAVWPYG